MKVQKATINWEKEYFKKKEKCSDCGRMVLKAYKPIITMGETIDLNISPCSEILCFDCFFDLKNERLN